MTPRETVVVDMVRERLQAGVAAPSLREIGSRAGVSAAGAKGIVDRLVSQGVLARIPAARRSLRLADGIDLRGVASDALRAELARRGETLDALGAGTRLAFAKGAVTCAADCCQVQVERGKLFCRRHWFTLPRVLREDILRAFAAKDVTRYQELVARARDGIDSGRFEVWP
jgi:hypothetical protein